MTARIPFLLVGDGPADPTGLGRIARDLAAVLLASDLPLDLVQIGGSVPPPWTAWRHYPLDRADDWGGACVARYWQDLWGNQPGILCCVWDPGRLLPYVQLDLPVQRWAYTAIDGANVNGEISGPAKAALERFDRVLAYGRWASTILKDSLHRPISYLPHGITTDTYTAPASEAEQAWVRSILGPYLGEATLLGMVAANQPRKDFGIYFQTLAELRRRGHNVYGWVHTDVPVKAWAIVQLVEDLGLEKRITLTMDTFSDRQLALLYQRCDLTLLPTLGEGFGYPIVESLAAGTPVIHTTVAGGAELVPKIEWRVPARGERVEGIYGLVRPVYDPTDWANAAERAVRWSRQIDRQTVRAYLAGSVAHLDWSQLGPRWVSWVRQGLA